MEKLYYFDLCLRYGEQPEIKECKIIKETEKTYTVKIGMFANLVRKEDMKNGGTSFFISYDLAKQGLIDYLNFNIRICKMKIKDAQENIDTYNEYLRSIENEKEN